MQFVFCGNRKLAAEWARQFFAAVAACQTGSPGKLILGQGTNLEASGQ
ncbi:MAG: hypothetical protein GX493_01115 [Firmicutes bacterium]|nr:hypothetical protein [Bacillota bacterium]